MLSNHELNSPSAATPATLVSGQQQGPGMLAQIALQEVRARALRKNACNAPRLFQLHLDVVIITALDVGLNELGTYV